VSQSVKFAKVFTYSALIVLLTMPLYAFVMSDAGSTRVFIDPPSQTVGAIGDSFTVNVSVADVSNLYGYEFKLYYNSTVMNGTEEPIEGSFLKSGGQTPFWGVVSFTDHYNLTHGVVWIYCSLQANVSGIYGSGVLATIKFKSLALGDSVPLHLADVKLSEPYVPDIGALPIQCDVSDGMITVIPEFTSAVAVLTLIIASLFGIFFGKRVMRKVPNLNS
jgi:hypothetical protein